MKTVVTFLILTLSLPAWAQKEVKMKTLWHRPQVHVICGEYNISFTIRDIDKAMTFMSPEEQSTFGSSCGLDTNSTYDVELLPGTRHEYQNKMQSLIQNGVGAFLLMSGRAYVARGKKQMKMILSDYSPIKDLDEREAIYMTFYDPRNNAIIFSGSMNPDMYQKDLGFQDE